MTVATYVDLHLPVETVVEQQVVSHPHSLRLHRMSLPIVVVAYVTWQHKHCDKLEQQVVGHSHPLRLHRVALAIVIVAYVTWQQTHKHRYFAYGATN